MKLSARNILKGKVVEVGDEASAIIKASDVLVGK